MDQIILYLGIFAISLFVLLKASDFFVGSAEKIGLALGIPPFIIGVTIIAFGTSLPELASSLEAVFRGQSEIVLGNVVGSNVANIALVLGIVGVVGRKVQLNSYIMNIDVPILLTSSFLLWFIIYDQQINKFEAGLLVTSLAIFLIYSLKNENGDPEKTEKKAVNWRSVAILIVAGVAIKFGAEYTVMSIAKLSKLLNIGSDVIAASAVALGTSLPEVFVSLAAIRKNNADIAVGNILGSNIFNTYAVVGIPALVGDLVIPSQIVTFAAPFMIAMTFLFTIMCISFRLSRWEGWMLLIMYVFFLVELFK